MEGWLPAVAALWIGILTAISPCPLASNVAAISFVSYRVTHKRVVFASGVLYTLGRCLTYVVLGVVIIKALVSVPELSDFLQRYINKVLGILLILIGLVLLDVLRFKLPVLPGIGKLQERIDKLGTAGSFFLGILFALAFCPISAALFFGSLIPLAIKAESSVGLPLLYGVGTGLPVLVFAVLVAAGSPYLNQIYRGVTSLEFYTKRVTAGIFLVAGIYYVLAYVVKVI